MKQLYLGAVFLALLLKSHASIEYLNYHIDSIPNIVTSAGIATEIVFEADEEIQYSTFGFDSAWNSQVVKKHILVFKSTDPQPQTNLLVHTNKRDYVFTVTVGNNNWQGHPDKSGAVYALRLLYDDDKTMAKLKAKSDAKKAKLKAELDAEKARIKSKADAEQAKLRARAERRRAEALEKLESRKQVLLKNREITTRDNYLYRNYDYRATANARDVIPDYVWDNGKITFIVFRNGAKRGVAYEFVNDKTSIVNQHTERNGVLVVHGVYDKLLIRLGEEAVELRRNTQYGRIDNPTKTNVGGTSRTMKDAEPSSK